MRRDGVLFDSFVQLGDKTLKDVWHDYSLIIDMKMRRDLKPTILLRYINSDLAQALAELHMQTTFILSVLAGDEDFHGKEWDDVAQTEQEIADLKSLKYLIQEFLKTQQAAPKNYTEIIKDLAQANKDLAHENNLYKTKEWEQNTAYSHNKVEKVREISGEMLKDANIIIPNQKQKSEYPDCRWIIPCIKNSRGKVTGIEKPVSLWKCFCDAEGLGFWSQKEFCNGLYLLIDGKLVKV